MSSEIKRIGWHGVHGMQEDAKGDYVLHSDHEDVVGELTNAKCRWFLRAGEYLKRAHEAEAEVARLRAELNAATKAGLDAIATICEKGREADALRAEVEENEKAINVWRGRTQRAEAEAEGLRNVAVEASDFLVCLPRMSQNGTDAAAAHLINKIDAAMGEGQ